MFVTMLTFERAGIQTCYFACWLVQIISRSCLIIGVMGQWTNPKNGGERSNFFFMTFECFECFGIRILNLICQFVKATSRSANKIGVRG